MKESGLIIFFCAVLSFAASYARADQYSSIVYTPIYTIEPATSIENPKNYTGVASAISAAQCHFDGGSFDLQLCGAVGYSDNQEAFTFGIGKKYKDFLINGTVSIEDNKARYGVGLNWKIK